MNRKWSFAKEERNGIAGSKTNFHVLGQCERLLSGQCVKMWSCGKQVPSLPHVCTIQIIFH
jgi:hypothetical protein